MFRRFCAYFVLAVFALFCVVDLNASESAKKAINTKVVSLNAFFYNGSEKGVIIELDKKVSDSELRKQIRITPAIGFFSVDRLWHETNGKYRICGKFTGGRQYTIKITGGLTGDGEYNISAYSKDFTAAEAVSKIEFPTNCSVIELHSKQTVPLKFQHIGNFKTELITVPAFLAHFYNDIAINPPVDEKDYNSSAMAYIYPSIADDIAQNSEKLEQTIESTTKSLISARALVDSCPDISNFVAKDFTRKSQTFLGSDNPDNEYSFSLPFDLRNEPEKGGTVLAVINETDKTKPAKATRAFQITDMSITYKFSKRELLVWVTSLETGKPLADVPVMITDAGSNSYFPGRTDKEGLLIVNDSTDYNFVAIKDNKASLANGKFEISNLRAVTVATQSDSAYVTLEGNRIYSNVQMSAPDMRKLDTIRAYAFTDRGVYKPGERINWKAALREYKEEKVCVPEADVKANVVIFNSRGDSIFEQQFSLSEYGTCEGSFDTKSFMPRGQYRLEIAAIQASKNFGSLGKQSEKWDALMQRKPSVVNEQQKANPTAEQTTTGVLYTCNFHIQDFEAPRHFVDMEMTSTTRRIRQIVGRDADQAFMDCRITGKYYAGGVLKNAKIQWSAYLTEKESTNSEYPGFCFGSNDVKRELLEQGNSTLDKNGQLVVSLPLSKAVLSGLNKIEVTATVLDIDGKPATSVKAYAPAPAVRVGITKLPSNVSKGCEYPVQVIALDNTGNRINAGNVTLEVMRKKYMYVQKRASDGNGGLYYNWQEVWLKSYSLTEKINSSVAEFNLSFPEGGDYLIRAHYVNGQIEAVADEKVMIDYSFSSYEDVAKNSRTRSANEIFLSTDKTVLSGGQAVKVKYTLPRLCDYALVTIETDKIINARVIRLNGIHGEFTENITDECKPNAFISFVAPSVRSGFPVYSIDADTEYPRAYFGFTSVKVQSSVDSIKVAIAPEANEELKSRPGESFKLNVKLTDSAGKPVVAEATVGVVDESVLALTGYVTPVLTSLSNFFMPLSVFTGDLRVALINQELFQLLSTRLLTGGGEGVGQVSSDLHARKDFRPVAFWKADCVSDEKGNISVEFKLPDTMTSYRIYVVANDKGSSFGSADAQLRVAKDFYIEPSVPQYLTAGDQAVVITTAHNKTDKEGTANVAVAGASGVTATIQNGSTALGSFNTAVTKVNLVADKGALDATLVMKGEMNGNIDAVDNTIPVKPASVIFNRYATGSFIGKGSVKADIPAYVASMNDLNKTGTLNAHITISPTPWTKLVPAISYLMEYPHGCVEQTSSRIIGLASVRNIAKEGVFKELSVAEVDAYLKDSLEHLLKNQLTNGGFSYWASEPSISWWGTQYAVYALTMLKESGYEFDQVYLNNGLDYVKRELFNSNDTKFTFKQPVFGLGVVALAMNNKINNADLQMLKKKFDASDKELEIMMLLAETYVGERSLDEYGFKLLSMKPMKLESKGWNNSSVRRDAFVLMANARVKGAKKVSDSFAGSLFGSLTSKGYWTSTADTGIALNALASYFQTQKPVNDKDYTVKITTKNGTKEIKIGKVPESLELTAEDLADEIKLEAGTKNLVNYSLSYTYPDMVGRNEVVDNGFLIDKTIENMNGSKDIRVGDIVKVTFRLERTNHKGSYEYLAVEDPIPAGFTAINTSLKNDAMPSDASAIDEEAYCGYYDGYWDFYPTHNEFRKDAMVAYKDYCWDGKFKMVYYLRATCEGTFVMKPSQCNLMYNENIYGLSKAGTVKILPAN